METTSKQDYLVDAEERRQRDRALMPPPAWRPSVQDTALAIDKEARQFNTSEMQSAVRIDNPHTFFQARSLNWWRKHYCWGTVVEFSFVLVRGLVEKVCDEYVSIKDFDGLCYSYPTPTLIIDNKASGLELSEGRFVEVVGELWDVNPVIIWASKIQVLS